MFEKPKSLKKFHFSYEEVEYPVKQDFETWLILWAEYWEDRAATYPNNKALEEKANIINEFVYENLLGKKLGG